MNIRVIDLLRSSHQGWVRPSPPRPPSPPLAFARPARLAFAGVALAVIGCLDCLGCGGGGASSGVDGSASGGPGGHQTGSGGDNAAGGAAGSNTGGHAAGGAAGSNTGGTGGGPAVQVGTVIEPGNPGAADVTFQVRADQGTHAISPLVYGWNGTPDIAKNRMTVGRSGGNRLTAYNWETNDSNAGSDYLFENDGLLSKTTVPGDAVKGMLQTTHDAGATAILTVPIVDYVAGDRLGGGDVRSSGANYLMTRFKQNRPTKGAAFSLTPVTDDAFVYQDEFVNWVKQAVPGARPIFSLDNEPDLWATTHAEVHPDKPTYDEIIKRNTDYANAIKAAWPEAEVTGLVSFGYYGYTSFAAADADKTKGDFLNYYLDHMKAAETAAGKRLIDYLDLHWYPEATGGGVRVTQDDTTDAVVAARLQAPRSLWDATYIEKSWITDCCTDGAGINLLKRVGDKIAAHYPGTKLAFTEYNFGAGGHISGGLATADVLGIFGREGVSVATEWPLGTDTFNLAALRVYRNFDGAGASFGDTSIQVTTSDVPSSSVYASIDRANVNRIVIVAINKQNTPRTAAIRVAHPHNLTSAAVYTLTAASPELAAAPALTAAATNAFKYTMPAWSVSVIVPR